MHAAPDLPPSNQAALQRMFDPQLAPLGLHTTRAALQDPHDYRRSAKGTHLAMYVEPTAQGLVDRATYVRNIMRVAHIFLPSIYKRWPGLKSFDICQEPEQVLDPRPAPIPVTQLVASRQAAATVDWKHATLVTLLRRRRGGCRQEGRDARPLPLCLAADPRRALLPGGRRRRRRQALVDVDEPQRRGLRPLSR